MDIGRLVGRWAKRRLRGAPNLRQSMDEAASQYLGKQAKLQTATDAVFVQDLHQLAEDDRQSVRYYKQRKGLAPPAGAVKGGDMPGDVIVCDDYRVGNGMWIALVAAAAIAASGYAVWRSTQPTSATINAVEDTDTQYRLEGDFEPAPQGATDGLAQP